jgi:hypothetical protein
VSAHGDSDSMRDAAREVLRELLPDLLRDALATPAGVTNGNGHHAHSEESEPVPQVPAPPVAAVLRPSTWTAPPAPGEVVGDNLTYTKEISQAPATAPSQGRVETVTIESDDDLDDFVRSLAKRLENPRDRRAVRTGQVRFALRRGAAAAANAAAAAGGPTLRVEKGAVTERIVRQAARESARLVLARGAVLTPLARDQAKALGVEIEKERTC